MAQDFSFGPVSARAPLHARPWSEKPRQACTLLPILETALELHWIPAHRKYKTGVPAMFALSRSKFAAMLIACGLLATSSAGVHAHPSADETSLATALRGGGLVILVRHGATFADQADTDPFNFDNIAAQRNLNENGKALAKAFGDALRQAGVPVGKVYTSKFNRAYETAVVAGFKDIEK